MSNSVAFEYALLDDQNIENWFRERGVDRIVDYIWLINMRL